MSQKEIVKTLNFTLSSLSLSNQAEIKAVLKSEFIYRYYDLNWLAYLLKPELHFTALRLPASAPLTLCSLLFPRSKEPAHEQNNFIIQIMGMDNIKSMDQNYVF